MLFNSYAFIFLFLPLTLLLYYGARKIAGAQISVLVLILASLLFYAAWNPPYLLLLLTSIGANYLVSLRLQHAIVNRKAWLITGITFNILLLGYYKYTHFLLGVVAPDYHVENILLPLGISFFTFQQIMFLTDIYRFHGAQRPDLTYYTASVTFFPHLIAGPIVPYRELMPQFENQGERGVPWEQVAAGLVLFTLGLVKKVLLADPLADPVDQVFSAAEQGGALNSADAWGGALAYTFQLYFDFSGYTDMALGLGHMFGIRLPANFLSPYKALSITEFWRCWHITLSNFLRDHLYIPFGGNRKGPRRTAINLLLTMGLGGLWHGAGFTFIVWGLMHGGYLVVHRVWSTYGFVMPRVFAWAITFLAIVLGWVMFRAPSVDAALVLYQSMLLGPMGAATMVSADDGIRILVLAAIALLSPNTIQLVRGGIHQPAYFRPRVVSALLCAVLFMASVLLLSRPSEFLYFNF